MSKRLVIYFLTTVIMALSVSTVSAGFVYDYEKIIVLTTGEDLALVNGSELWLDEPAYEKDGRTFVPLRFVAQALGADVKWDGNTNTANLTLNDTDIKVVTKSKNAYVNGREIKLEVSAETRNERLFVPLRFIAEAFGADVEFDDEDQAIKVVMIDKANWQTIKLPASDVEVAYPPDWQGEIDEEGYLHFKSPLGTEVWYSVVLETISNISEDLKKEAETNGYYSVSERVSKDGNFITLVYRKSSTDGSLDSMYLVSILDIGNGTVGIEEVLSNMSVVAIDMPIVLKLLAP